MPKVNKDNLLSVIERFDDNVMAALGPDGWKGVRVVTALGKEDRPTRTWVLSVPAETRNVLINVHSVYVDCVSCPTGDFLSVIRCYKCNGFGHMSGKCGLKEDRCPKCSGPHRREDCKAERVDFKCSNCVRSKLVDTNHSASDSRCPVFMRHEELALKTIQYG